MADKATSDQWEEIRTGLGTEIPLGEGGSFTGTYTGPSATVIDGRDQSVYSFTVDDGPEDGFLWGSWELDKAFADVQPGSRVRVTYRGKRDIGPGRQPMKSYRVEVARG